MGADGSFLEDVTGRPGLLDPDPVDLPEPATGGRELRHDAGFVALDAGLSALRDTINLGIGALNQAGVGLPRLPEGSLEELLVLPLTGDYRRIRQNAEATHQVERALATYAGNVHRLSLAVDPRWGGQAASSYLLRVTAHGLAARGLAELVGEGSVVFDTIADYSERLGIEVEELVAELAERGRRVVRRLLTRVAGPAGWGVFALEVATQGLDAVTDIVDDIRRILEIVDRLLALKEEVAAWVEEQRALLEVLLGLPDVFGGGGGGGSW